jgi:endoribonuclease Dicer
MLTWNLAVIDLVVMSHLFERFPAATSGQLSAARSRAVCGPTLASVAVNRLGLHKHLLINNVELSTAITRHIPLLETLSPEDAILKGWKYDPPKALSDVLESLVGAVLVDSAYNFEKTASVVEVVMSDVLAVLTTTLPRDPVSELMIWAATEGCKRIAFQQVPHSHRLIRTDFFFLVGKVRAMQNSDEMTAFQSSFMNLSSWVPLQRAICHCQKVLPLNGHALF